MNAPRKFSWLLLLLVLWCAGFLIYFIWPEETTELPPGVRAPEEPLQTSTTASPWHLDDYLITPLADFQIKAKVLHIKWYSSGRESDVSPLDLALGWGRMSDQNVVDDLDISQESRWYHWKAEYLPIPDREIGYHSANMHIIPASSSVEDALHGVHRGDIIVMTGYLVDVKAPDGWHWRSSLSRTDVGNGACELVWVTGLKVVS